MGQHSGLRFDSDFVKCQPFILHPEPDQDGGAKPDPTIANNMVFDSFGMYKKMIAQGKSFLVCQETHGVAFWAEI